MGAVSSIANKKMRMLRERYINEEDQVIFRLLCIRDRIVTDLIKIMAEMDTDEQGPSASFFLVASCVVVIFLSDHKLQQ